MTHVITGKWDYDHTCYPYIDKFQDKFFVGWVYADANEGCSEAPLWVEEDGETWFAYELFDSVELAMASMPQDTWEYKYQCKSGRIYLIVESTAKPCFNGFGYEFSISDTQDLERVDARLRWDDLSGQYV